MREKDIKVFEFIHFLPFFMYVQKGLNIQSVAPFYDL